MAQTTKTNTRRASSAPLYWDCPAAAYADPEAVVSDPINDAGTLGSAVHAACEAFIQAGEADLGNVGQFLGLDASQMEELRILYAVFCRFWQEYGPQFPHPHTEQGFVCGNDSGHIDLWAMDGDLCRVLDLKTTRLEAVSYHAQMMMYLWLVCQEMGVETLRFQYTLLFLRDKTIEVSKEFTVAEIDAWHAEYVKRLETWDGKTYHPSGKCQFCPRRVSCPGLTAELAYVAKALAPVEEAVNALSDADRVKLWERTGMVANVVEQARTVLRHLVQDAGAIHGDGKSLVLREKTKQSILAREAWPVMVRQGLSEAEIAECVTIGKGKLLDAVGAKAPPRGKGRAKAMFMEELEAAGAVETKTYTEVRLVSALPAASETEIADTESERSE